jgi:hypothetical protein
MTTVMKAIVTSEQTYASRSNPVQERINLLSEKGFLWREIAELTGLPKKLIKGIAKSEYFPSLEEGDRLCKIIDETIARLRNSVDGNDQNSCPEADLDAQDHTCYKLDVKSVTLYKGTDDDKMIVQIHGIILNHSHSA